MARPKEDIKTKVQKEFPDFTEVVDGLSIEQLEKRLSSYAKEGEAVETARENDEALQDAKDLVAELSGPYKDAKKAIRLKTKYIISLIEEKGGEV